MHRLPFAAFILLTLVPGGVYLVVAACSAGLLSRRVAQHAGWTMDIATFLVSVVASSEKPFFVMGIMGHPCAGKRTLARDLTEKLRAVDRIAETEFADERYFIQVDPETRIRRRSLVRDIRKFQQGERIRLASGKRIQSETSVLLVLATLKYLPEDLDTWAAFDYRVFITAHDAKHRLDRRLKLETRSKAEGGAGRSEGEIVGEFMEEQLREFATIDMIRQSDCIWAQDTNEILI